MKNSLLICVVFLLGLFTQQKSFAQAERISYSNETKLQMTNNINSGLEKYHGLKSKFTFVCEPNKFLPATQQNIISQIKALNEVKNCEIVPDQYKIIITAKAKENCPNYADYKSIIVGQGLEISDTNEYIFK